MPQGLCVWIVKRLVSYDCDFRFWRWIGAPYCKIHVVLFMTFSETTPKSDGKPPSSHCLSWLSWNRKWLDMVNIFKLNEEARPWCAVAAGAQCHHDFTTVFLCFFSRQFWGRSRFYRPQGEGNVFIGVFVHKRPHGYLFTACPTVWSVCILLECFRVEDAIVRGSPSVRLSQVN